MGSFKVEVSRKIQAPREVLYKIISDYNEHHPQILPKPPFDKLIVTKGGVGEGTEFKFNSKMGPFDMWASSIVKEIQPGYLLEEREVQNKFVTHFTLIPEADGVLFKISSEFFGIPRILVSLIKATYGKTLLKTFNQELELIEKYALSRKWN